MKPPSLLTSSSSPSTSWLSPTLTSDSTPAGSSLVVTTRVLHLAPSRQLNEAWYISLIQEARTWEGNLCLHLQPHPIPWIFVVQYEDDVYIHDHQEPVAAAAMTAMPTSLHVSEVVWSELMALIQTLPKQGRGLHLILEKDFIPNSTTLKHLLTVAAPSLIRIETNHPCLLPDLVPNMATRCPSLRTLAMDIPTTLCKFQSHPHHNPVVSLTLFLRDPFCQLKRLHLHFSSTIRRQQDTRKQQLLPIGDLFATIADCLHIRRTIQALKVSGGQLDSVLNALLSHHDWPFELTSTDSSSLKKLEIESSHLQLAVIPNDDETTGVCNNLRNHEVTFLSTSTLSNFFQSSVVENITHLTIRVKAIKVQTLPPTLQQEPTLSTPFLSPTIVPDSIVVSSLTHLTLQASLTTAMVDSLLVQLHVAAPNLQELDLEGNDMESLELPKFLLTVRHDNDSRHRFPNLQKLFLGSNLFSYTTQKEWIEHLVFTCPRLDVGHRGMPSCGILDDDEYENGILFTEQTGRCGSKRSLFTSWAHLTPLALAWKDWNEHGRYLILQQHSSRVPSAGLWPLVLNEITKHFHRQPTRQVTLLFLFLQSGAIPFGGAKLPGTTMQ